MAFDWSLMTKELLGEIEIDIFNVEKGVKQFEKLANEMDDIVEVGLANSAEKIREKLIEEMDSFGITSLQSSIIIDIGSDGFTLMVGAEHGVFIEYGTGIRGSENPHPEPWQYDVNGHGEEGWWYYDADHKLHWTAGTEAKPFFYNTMQWVRRYGLLTREIRKEMRRRLR